jgi:PhnB protein
MATDPLIALRLPVEPIEPRPEFAADLRRRLEGALMSTTTTPTYVPPRMRAVNAYLAVSDARSAIDWYKEVFGAVETMEPIIMDDGRVGHAEFQIGDVVMMISDEFPDLNVLGPNARGGSTTAFVIYVPNVDETFAAALEAGAIQDRPVEDQFHGSRAGWLRDPWGHRWNIATPIADR